MFTNLKLPSPTDRNIDFGTFYALVANQREMLKTSNRDSKSLDIIRIAKITVDVSSEEILEPYMYNAVEVFYDSTTLMFELCEGQPGWADATPTAFPSLVSIAPLQINDIVVVTRDPRNKSQWIVISGAMDEGTADEPKEMLSGIVDTAYLDTWHKTPVDGDTDPLHYSACAIKVPFTARPVYNATGDKILYKMVRFATFTSGGILSYVSAETRVEVDKPADCTLE